MSEERFEKRKKEIASVINDLNWKFSSNLEKTFFGTYSISISTKSPAGEELVAPVFFDGTVSGFVKGVEKAAEMFDPDEHVKLEILAGEVFGAPRKIRALLDDANASKQMLLDLVSLLHFWFEIEYLPEARRSDLEGMIKNFEFSKCTLDQLEFINEILSN